MAKFEKGNMWDVYGRTSLFLVTTNPIINKNGELVMGRGIAQQMKENFPGAATEYAKMVSAFPSRHVGNFYYEPVFGFQHVGYFMVKKHWAEPASIPVILRSTADLLEVASWWDRIDLNFPGIGNGKLSRDSVEPIMSYLPDNVHIWEYE